MKRAWSLRESQELWHLHKRGWSIRRIADHMDRDPSVVRRHAERLNLRFTSSRRPWSDADIARLRAEYPDASTAAFARSIGRTVGQVYQAAERYGVAKSAAYLAGPHACRLRRGGDVGAQFRFRNGDAPWNKGQSYNPGGRSAETRFRPGTLNGAAAVLYVPIGTERVTKEGVRQRKVSEHHHSPRDWRAVHTLLWEEHNGPVPSGHIVVFKAGAPRDPIAIEHLELISRAENMRRNSYHNRYPKEVAQLIQLRGALNRKINRRARA